MPTTRLTLPSSLDEIDLSVLVTTPGTPPRGILQMVHGMSEHKERYLPMMEWLSSMGFVCCMHDNRGHGQSIREERDLGYMYEGRDRGLVEDVWVVNNYLHRTFQDIPLFMYGHSMGSLIVRCYLKKYACSIDGLIVCGSPSWNSSASAGRMLCRVLSFFQGERKRSRLMTNLTLGGFSKGIDGSANGWLSTIEEEVLAYDNDPLCGFPFTLNGYYSLLSLLKDCYRSKDWHVNCPDLPIWFIAGEMDPCIGNEALWRSAQENLRLHGYRNITCKLYPGVRHEIHNDTSRQMVREDILGKLEEWSSKG